MNHPIFNSQQLISFIAVCETENFTRAAERVCLSQSTVSQHIQKLELWLGKSLFVRSSHQVQLTEAGETFLAYARRIIALQGEAYDALSDKWREGVLRLGVPEDYAPLTAPLLAQFRTEHPHLRLNIISGMQVELRKAWQNDELDIMLIKQQKGERPYAARPEPLAWLDSLHSPVFEQSPIPLVVFPIDGLYRQQLCESLDNLGLSWRISYSSSSLQALIAASAAGLGMTLLPASCIQSDHRILDSKQQLPTIDNFELALFIRQQPILLQQRLADLLVDFCQLKSV